MVKKCIHYKICSAVECIEIYCPKVHTAFLRQKILQKLSWFQIDEAVENTRMHAEGVIWWPRAI